MLIKMNMNSYKRLTLTRIVIAVVILTSIFANLQRKMWTWEDRIIQWDVKSYYAYLPAAIIHGDLSLEFTKSDPDKYIKNYWPGTAPNRAKVIVTSMGMAFLYLPFFFIAHVWALLGGYEADGYSLPYLVMIQFSVLPYLLLGLVLLRKILLKYFSEIATALALAGVGLGTNLFYYSNAEGAMSHGFSFALYAALLYLTIKWWAKPTLGKTVLVGLLLGLIVLIRPTNIVVLLVFGFYGVTTLKGVGERILFFIKKWNYVLVIGLCALLVWAPQLVYWKWLTGDWFYYSYGDNANFFWTNPQFINGLFSYRKGWFVYTPIMIFAVLGLIQTYRKHREFFTPVALFLIVNLYVVFSWWNWWYGGGFGQRALIESYAVLAFPMAAFIDAGVSGARWKRIATISTIMLFTAQGLFMNIQYYSGVIHWDSMTKEAYWKSLFRSTKHPNLNRYLQRLDYEFARKGIYIPEKKPSTFVAEAAACDMETIDATGARFLSVDGSLELHNAKQQTSRYSRSGSHSVVVNSDTPFALNHRISVKPGDQLEFEIWRHSKSSHEAALIMSAQDANNFYKKSDRKISSEGDWDQLVYTLVVPKDYPDSLLVVYVWSPKRETAFFDDYSVKRMTAEQQNESN